MVSAAAGRALASVAAAVQPILSVAVSADGEVAACGRGEEIYVYELDPARRWPDWSIRRLAGHSGRGGPGIAHLDIVQALAFQPGGDLLASSGFREVKLWRRATQCAAGRFDRLNRAGSPPRRITAARGAATGESGGLIRLWELPSGKPLATCTGHSAAVTGLRFTPDGTKLVSASADKTIRLWNVPAGTEAGKIETPAPIGAMTLVRGGTQVCTGHADGVIRIWATPGARPRRQRQAEGPEIAQWNCRRTKELKGHTAAVTGLDIASADGLQILSGSSDATVRGWNIDNGQQTRQVAQGAAVTAVAMAPTFAASLGRPE